MRALIAGLVLTLAAGIAVLLVLLTRPVEVPLSPLEVRLAATGVQLELPPEALLLRADPAEGPLNSALFAIGEDQLRLRVTPDLDAAAAAARVLETRQVIDNLFGDRQAPYPGQLSHTLRCPDRFQPAAVEPRGEALAMLTLYANDRLTFGGCSEDLLRYHATVGFFHDPVGRRLFQVEYFAALESQRPDPGPALLRSLQLSGD